MKLSPPTRPSEPLATGGPPAPPVGLRYAPPSARARPKLSARHWFLICVLLPTMVVAAYHAFVAADIYESEARFLVRGRSGGGSGIDALAGRAPPIAAALAGARPAAEESRAVTSWIDSHAAVIELQRDVDLVQIWRRPEADPVSRLWWDHPQLEWLLWYYRRRVAVSLDPDTGVMQLRVQAFRPADAQRLAEEVLGRSEALVNTLSSRSIADSLRVAQEDVHKAERRVAAAREAMISFREREQALDPSRSAVGALDNIGRLETALGQARADLQERRSFMRPDNPQIRLLENRIAALTEQIGTERSRITRGSEALTGQMAGFERLELERALADRELASATTSLENARSDALRQHVFIMRVADPQLPEWPRYPRATFNTVTVLVSLSVLFGIGWLLVVSAREHAS